MATADDKIVLGSGKLYISESTADIGEITKTYLSTLAVDANLLGLIQGGASIEYKPEFYQANDDLGIKRKTILTKEAATLKSGVMTWCGKTLKKLCSTARVTEDALTGLRVVKIGGINNADGMKYILLFVSEDPVDGNCYILIIGQNQAGFTLAFAKDKETVIDAEFVAMPADTDGTLVIYAEEIPVAGG